MKIRSSHFKKQFDLTKAELIGEGNFAQVYRIFDSELNDSLAIRKVNKNQSDLEDIFKEKIINEELRKVENQNILKIYDIIETQEAVWYITEYCSGGSLWDALNLCKDNKMNERECLQCVLQISKGVQQLHNHRITHRDLKPENILLKTKYTQKKALPLIKLADFGLSTQKIIMQTIAGTKEYIAPEQAKFHNYTNAVDVWSLGIICDQILHGTPFYSGQNNKEVFNKILKTPYKVRDESLRQSIKNFLISLLKKKPYERPIIAVIRKNIQKILEEIEQENFIKKSQSLKKKQVKQENLPGSIQIESSIKYTNVLGLDIKKVQPKRPLSNERKEYFQKMIDQKNELVKVEAPVNEIKSPLKQSKQISLLTSTVKKQVNFSIPNPLFQSLRPPELKKQQVRKQQLKRQKSNKKPQPSSDQLQRSLQRSKIKQTKAQSLITTDKSNENQKENKIFVSSKNIIVDQKIQPATLQIIEPKKQSVSPAKFIENILTPIYKMQKKKVLVPQPKKQMIKVEQMDVQDYIQRLIQSKKQLQDTTSCIKADKIPSFLPNTYFTAQQFSVSTAQSMAYINQFKKEHEILNFIQYNDEYDVNIHRKMVQIQKNKKKCLNGLRQISIQLKSQFLKQVDSYVEGYIDKILK